MHFTFELLYNKLHKRLTESYKRVCYIKICTNLKTSHIKINLLPVRKKYKNIFVSRYRLFSGHFDTVYTKEETIKNNEDDDNDNTASSCSAGFTPFTPASHLNSLFSHFRFY